MVLLYKAWQDLWRRQVGLAGELQQKQVQAVYANSGISACMHTQTVR